MATKKELGELLLRGLSFVIDQGIPGVLYRRHAVIFEDKGRVHASTLGLIVIGQVGDPWKALAAWNRYVSTLPKRDHPTFIHDFASFMNIDFELAYEIHAHGESASENSLPQRTAEYLVHGWGSRNNKKQWQRFSRKDYVTVFKRATGTWTQGEKEAIRVRASKDSLVENFERKNPHLCIVRHRHPDIRRIRSGFAAIGSQTPWTRFILRDVKRRKDGHLSVRDLRLKIKEADRKKGRHATKSNKREA